MTAAEVAEFGREVADQLASALDDSLIGAYFVGSVALGGYVAGESDIDIAAVCRHALGLPAKSSVVRAVETAIASCPARGLEFSLYNAAVVAAAPRGADFEVNVNGGTRMERLVRLDSADQPSFWYILDRGIAHRAGVTIVGPPAGELFAAINREELLRAMAESMQWHRDNEPESLYSVLNATRAWRFAVTGELGSKLEGAAWAAKRWPEPGVIEAAVEVRHGRPAHIAITDAKALLTHVHQLLVSTRDSRPLS